MTQSPAQLRQSAEALAAPFPALLAEAEQLAATVMLGGHGRRRAGQGDAFWQFRPALPWDEAKQIDWRRSAKSEGTFVREKEWQVAQSVLLWVDQGASMAFQSDKCVAKSDRARALALAIAILLMQGGERVGLSGGDIPARAGRQHLTRLAYRLAQARDGEYGAPDVAGLMPNARAMFVSDFLGDLDGIEAALAQATDRGIRGVLLQVLDPQEEDFPFHGRTIFQSMGGAMQHETLQAHDLRDRYLTRLAERKDALLRLARTSGWQFMTHHTNRPASEALLWAYSSLEHR